MTAGSQPRGRGRIGVFGGTFDPPHLGHLVAGSEAAAALDLDAVLFVPTGRPWQKSGAAVTPGEHRYRMTLLSTGSDERFQVSRVDLDRPGPTYTVDTLRDLRSQRPDTDWFFLTGADTLASLATWKDAAEVVRHVTVVGMTRPGTELVTPSLPDATIIHLPIPALEISSRDCRERVRAGRPLRYLVPDAVMRYITEHRLYLAAAD